MPPGKVPMDGERRSSDKPGGDLLPAWVRKMLSLRAALALVVVCVVETLPTAEAPTPAFADRFADSVGVNVHLHYAGTLYTDFELVRTKLAELGLRHLRDGLYDTGTTWQAYYDRHNALGAMGIKGLFTVAAPNVPEETLRTYPSRMSSSFEAYEATNEYDLSGVAAWPSLLRQSLVQLYGLRQESSLSKFPLYGPALSMSAAAFAALGNVSAYFDVANLHYYMAGRHPGTPGWGDGGYGSIDWNLAFAKRYATGKPIAVTETGYYDDLAIGDSAPAAIVGRYMPRLLLEQFRKGVQRTYIYELIDDPTPGVPARSGFGLIRADGSSKPAFRAVAGLIRVFSDRGANVTPQSFTYTLEGGDANVRQMAFQKRDGTMLLAIWIEAAGFDVGTRQMIAVPPQTVRITAPAALPLARSYRWLEDGNVLEDTTGAGQANVSLAINDALTVLQFGSPRRAVPRQVRNLRIVN